MKVCIFLPSLAAGGAQGATLRIASALVGQGHAVDLLTARDQQAPNHRPDPRVHWTTFSHRHARSAILDVAGHLRRRPADVLLTATDPANVAGLVAARLSRTDVPVVVTFHNDVAAASRLSHSRFSRVRPTVTRWTIARAARVVTVSLGAQAGLAALAPRHQAKISMIYNPTIDDSLLALAAEPVTPRDGLDLAHTVIAMGRLAPVKGFDVLLPAFARAAADDERLQLLIGGEGPGRDELARLARDLGIADRVHLPGYLSNPYQYLARCRLLVLSSRYEGLPTVLVEAGALGCPIVATDCPSGPRELLEGRDGAVLVPVDDIDVLGAAIRAALGRPCQAVGGDWTDHTLAEGGRRYEALLLAASSPAAQPGDVPRRPTQV